MGVDGPQQDEHEAAHRHARGRGAEGRSRKRSTTIARVAGQRPKGWLGSGLQETWNTLDFLAAEGVEYVCDWTNDDQPYVMTLESGQR